MPPSSPQDRCDPTGTVERILRVDLVDLPFERQLLLAGASRLIVQMRSVQAQEFRLGCQGRNEMPQDRRSKVPQKRRFEKSPASVVLLHRGRRGKMTEHAGFQFLLQAIALAANVDGDGMMQQAVQDGRRDHMVVKNVTPGAVALVAG